MRDSVSNHDLFPSRVEQGEPYRWDRNDLTKPTPDQYERYSDGSHRGKKKVDEKTEAERKRVEVKTKAGEMYKKKDVSKTSRDVDLTELMKQREEQVAVQNAGKVEARKRKDVLEQERAAAEKKMWAEQQKKDNDQKKKRVEEEWQKKLLQEERKLDDKIQFDKSMAKTLEIEGSKTGSAPVKTVPRRDMTSAEMDQEFRELNAAQMRVNARAAVDQIVGSEVNRKKKGEKSVIVGKRMMRMEEGTKEGNQLPPIALMLSAGSKGNVLDPQDQGVENTKLVKEKKGRKILKIPESVVEEMDVKGGKEDFGIDQRTEVVVEMPLDLPGGQDVVEVEEPVEALSSTLLQEILSDRMEMGEGYDLLRTGDCT